MNTNTSTTYGNGSAISKIQPKSHKSMMPRRDILMLISVTNGLGQGDPDAGNAPRVDINDHEFITNAGIKRAIRDCVAAAAGDTPGFGIFVARGSVLEDPILDVIKNLKATLGRQPTTDEVRQEMCRLYWGVRTFGGVLSPSKEASAGRVKGPFQFSDAVSVEPTTSAHIGLTRNAVSDNKRSKKMNGKNQDMGSRDRSSFVLYECDGTFNPFLAVETGFSQTDFDVMMDVLPRMYSFGQSGQSAVGGIRTVQKIFVFEHSTPRGHAQPEKLFDLVRIERKNPNETPRCFQDYAVTVGTPPPGVKVIEIDT